MMEESEFTKKARITVKIVKTFVCTKCNCNIFICEDCKKDLRKSKFVYCDTRLFGYVHFKHHYCYSCKRKREKAEELNTKEHD